MKTIMFTRDNAARFWTHAKQTTIRVAGASGKPRFKVSESASLRIWLGDAYRSKTYEFGTARILMINRVEIDGDKLFVGSVEPGAVTTNRTWKNTVAKRDGFDSWSELKAALNLHHGETFEGFRYWFNDLHFHPNALAIIQERKP